MWLSSKHLSMALEVLSNLRSQVFPKHSLKHVIFSLLKPSRFPLPMEENPDSLAWHSKPFINCWALQPNLWPLYTHTCKHISSHRHSHTSKHAIHTHAQTHTRCWLPASQKDHQSSLCITQSRVLYLSAVRDSSSTLTNPRRVSEGGDQGRYLLVFGVWVQVVQDWEEFMMS